MDEIDKIPKDEFDRLTADKKLIVFDLDGTLAESKSDIDPEMTGLLEKLLEKKKIAVIGGGKFELFERQLLSKLQSSGELKNLFLFPTTATAFYRFNGAGWREVYSEKLTNDEKEKILAALDKTFEKLNYKHPDKIYGEPIEDRGAEIVFSALGQEAPLEEKEKWNKENPDIRSKMEKILQNYLPDMEAKVTGLTSIDVTRKGIDKSYGIRQMEKYLGVPTKEMLFVGNDFSREGNDEPVLKTGVLCFEVKGFGDTKKLIRYLL